MILVDVQGALMRRELLLAKIDTNLLNFLVSVLLAEDPIHAKTGRAVHDRHEHFSATEKSFVEHQVRMHA